MEILLLIQHHQQDADQFQCGYLQSETYFLKFIILIKDAHKLLKVSSHRKMLEVTVGLALSLRAQAIYPGFMLLTQQKGHPGATATIL